MPDTPTHIAILARDFDRSYDGVVRADTALARSRNVPAVWMLRRFGVDRTGCCPGHDTLHRPPSDYGLSLILGGSEGTLWEPLASTETWLVGAASRRRPHALTWRADVRADEARCSAAAAWLTLKPCSR